MSMKLIKSNAYECIIHLKLYFILTNISALNKYNQNKANNIIMDILSKMQISNIVIFTKCFSLKMFLGQKNHNKK